MKYYLSSYVATIALIVVIIAFIVINYDVITTMDYQNVISSLHSPENLDKPSSPSNSARKVNPSLISNEHTNRLPVEKRNGN